MASRTVGGPGNGSRVAGSAATDGVGASLAAGRGARTLAASLLVDPVGRLLFADAQAELLIRTGTVLRLEGGRVAATTEQATAALRGTIRDVSTREGTATPLALPHAAGGEYPLLVSPSEEGGPSAAGQVLVQALDPEYAADGPSAAFLAAWFGLTPAESEVALRAARGEGLRAIAEALGVQHSTARSHLHRVFQKANLRRQAELAWLIAHLPR